MITCQEVEKGNNQSSVAFVDDVFGCPLILVMEEETGRKHVDDNENLMYMFVFQ